MKFSELYESNEDKLIKKAKHVYTALKKGVITIECNGPKKISYVLPENVEFRTIQLKDGRTYPCIELPEEGEEIEWLENGEKTNCTDYTGELFSILNERFVRFNVVLLDYNTWIEYPGYDYIDDISQAMGIEVKDEEDEEELGEASGVPPHPTEKQLKKVKAVYTALKRGIFTIADAKIKYVLSDDYDVEISLYQGGIIVVPNYIKDTKVPVIYYLIGEDGREIPVGPHNKSLLEKFNKRVIERFMKFNLFLMF